MTLFNPKTMTAAQITPVPISIECAFPDALDRLDAILRNGPCQVDAKELADDGVKLYKDDGRWFLGPLYMDEDTAETLLLADTEKYIDVCLGVSMWQNADGRYFVEADYRVRGEVWRVHKSDVDPFPSNPHAHCIGGAKRYVGCTLHLGTAELFHKRDGTGRYLQQDRFDRLLEMVRPKFPGISFPLTAQD